MPGSEIVPWWELALAWVGGAGIFLTGLAMLGIVVFVSIRSRRW